MAQPGFEPTRLLEYMSGNPAFRPLSHCALTAVVGGLASGSEYETGALFDC